MRTNEGHRERVKARFVKEGLENFDETHALELLLFYVIPRKDTKVIARRLIDQFGSFPAVLEADMAALQQVEGMGPAAAAYLYLLSETGRYYLKSSNKQRQVLTDINECGKYLTNFFVGKSHEEAYLLCLDGKCRVLGCHRLNEGTPGAVNISVREVVEIALNTNAVTVVLTHNHPNGALLPSESDVLTTRQIARMLDMVQVHLMDHIVVSGNNFVSMAQTGHYDPERNPVVVG